MGIYRGEGDGISLTAYTGDRAVLLAFDLKKERILDLAGFAVACAFPGTASDYFLQNRLNFSEGMTAKKKYSSDLWTPSDKAPFQTFHWTHYPSDPEVQLKYTAYPAYFSRGTTVELGPPASVTVDLRDGRGSNPEVGFTRSMISSQAYANRFRNRGLYPSPQTIDYDTKKYQDQYVWLGAHAREAAMGFLDGCLHDSGVTVDVFAFDLDEADIIRGLCALGGRCRVFQDNSTTHCSPESDVDDMKCTRKGAGKKELPHEISAVRALREAGVSVRTGHFTGLAHNKVMVRRRNGVPEAVLAGSSNFTLRGLYVQANSILVFRDAEVAALYAQAFEQAWNEPKKFKTSPIASTWHDATINGARYSFAFAPHKTEFPLDQIKDAMDGAKQSVMFAMMQMAGSGKAIDALKALPERDDIYSMGIIQMKGQMKLFKADPGRQNFSVVSRAYLAKDVPPPFDKEISGGSGQVIHHKFVVCDFNGENPVVFCGSSNLAKGGETRNGDNLMAIHDPETAIRFGVEAVRLYDHFRFRSKHEESSDASPLILDNTDGWAKPYYDADHIRYRERLALAGEKGV
jgi:hypothetical protein